MTITAADIRREVKEKNVTFLRLMFSDIAGTLKNVEIPAFSSHKMFITLSRTIKSQSQNSKFHVLQAPRIEPLFYVQTHHPHHCR